MQKKIITENVNPPIPVRSFDWSAHYDGEEETGECGWGMTEDAAIKDLKQCYPRCKNKGGHVGAGGECMVCDAEAGETCRNS